LNAPDLAGLPRDAAGAPVFPGLWQARAFALAVHLNARGAFAWPAFAAALGAELRREEDYWRAWLAALEALLAAERLAAPEAVAATAALWERAAERTPHGEPILLGNAG
jgi:nitrile hydratase accessory protein